MAEEERCAICRSDINNDTKELQCNHIYHGRCINMWLETHSSPCPVCRRTVLEACGDKWLSFIPRSNSARHLSEPDPAAGVVSTCVVPPEPNVQSIPIIPAGTNCCSICLSEIDGDAMELECKHQYHMQCIDTWLAIGDTCPLCRQGVLVLRDVNTGIAELNQHFEARLRSHLLYSLSRLRYAS